MAYTLDRCCVACRRMIPTDEAGEVLSFAYCVPSYSEKTGKMVGKMKQGIIKALCSGCTEQFEKLIKEQENKGIKVL